MASRMESTGEISRIQISQEMFSAIKHAPTRFIIEYRGLTEVKGKGEVMTYFLNGVAEDKRPEKRRVRVQRRLSVQDGILTQNPQTEQDFLEHL
eukprot:CAMPEP_0196576254 /NCGR_PEP_ID=MMETSP1081-20130531/5559_1 /TAXON_ID=36882 /ORGANISM="Pyramimonas amylifera, Strain CCMP720" /LENGTH=93 /DNA_ID=CAMNT_0041894809 /DNA_START=16 /DNA_END=293 /DNA_ORIENTATION=+